MIMHLHNETAKKLSRFLSSHNGWVTYQDHTFQCESFERLEANKLAMSADWRFDLTQCYECHELKKECKARDIFVKFVKTL